MADNYDNNYSDNYQDKPHVTYVKHLSSDQSEPMQGGSFINKIPGGWWTVGIGAATVIIGVLTLSKMNANNGTSNSSGYSYGSPASGTYYDTTGVAGGGMDQAYSQLMNTEAQNTSLLQSILSSLGSNNGVTTTPPSGGSSGGSTPPSGGSSGSGGISNPTTPNQPPVNWGSAPLPPSIGTPGYSTNRWIYTTHAGDTIDSLTNMAHWNAGQQAGGGPGFTYNYNGNSQIFSYYGINNPVSQQNQALPAGIEISL